MTARKRPLPESYADARARRERATADRVELENAARRAELLPAADVVEGWEHAISRTRSLLLGLPAASAEELVGIVRGERDDRRASALVREALADRIFDALTELADTSADDAEDYAP